jgi:hypothetical protein
MISSQAKYAVIVSVGSGTQPFNKQQTLTSFLLLSSFVCPLLTGGGGFTMSGCKNLDNGATDEDGDGCVAYTSVVWCDGYNDADFNAGDMCC